MASTHKHIRSSTANKRPTTAIADGQIALNTNASSPGLFFKDSTGASIIKIGPVHVGSTAPNATPGAGGSSGNSTGEIWLDNSLTPVGVKIWNGSAWVNATPVGSTTVQGLLELATSAETQTGTDTDRAVTPAGLQSKLSDSTSTTSSTTIASSTAVKSAYDLANAALPKSGGTITGNLEIGTTGSLSFEGSTADAFETTIAVTDPTADRTITLPDQTGNFLVSGNASIVNADVNASAAIAGTKISPNFGSQNTTTTGTSTAASFIPTGSSVPTNGVYLPATNSVAISTGGSGRLFVDASGNVGAGTSSPAFAAGGGIQAKYATFSSFRATVGANTGTDFSAASDGKGYIYVRDNADLLIGTNNTERLRITSAGLVGIGTSAPSRPLHVVGSAVFDDGTVQATIWPQIATNVAGFGTNNNYPVALVTNGSQRLHVTATGNVGIGDTAPSDKLTIAGGASGSYGLTINNAQVGGGTKAYFQYDATNQIANLAGVTTNGLAFYTLTSGSTTEKARLDASGRLLVGTSSARSNYSGITPYFQFENGSGNDQRSFAVTHNATNVAGPIVFIGKSRGSTVGSNTLVASGDELGQITFNGADGTNMIQAAKILCEVDGTPGANDMPGRLVFSTTADGASSPTERMRINSAGSVFTFTNSTGYVGVSNAGNNAAEAGFAFFKSATGIGSGTLCMQVKQDGDLENTNNSYGAISDLKLKENVVDSNSQWSDIKSLRVRRFNFKAETNYGTHTQIGLIAQEVELVSPGLVTESPDRDAEGNDLGTVTKSVNYSVLYMKAVKALQEAMERIETLEAKVAALESA